MTPDDSTIRSDKRRSINDPVGVKEQNHLKAQDGEMGICPVYESKMYPSPDW